MHVVSHVKDLTIPRLMPEAFSARSAALTGDEGRKVARVRCAKQCCAGAFRVAWRESTPAVGTAYNPAYHKKKAKQGHPVSPGLASTRTNSLPPIERNHLARTQPIARIVIPTLSWRATKRRRLHRTKPHLPKRSARTRPSSPAQLVFTHLEPCPPPPTAAEPRPNTSHTFLPDDYTSPPPNMEGSASNQDHSLDNAIRALREKKQVPEIDFTIHEMEDGSQVNTQERVCKGESCGELHHC